MIYDPVPEPIEGRKPLIGVREGEYIIVPASWDSDEPFDYLITELGSDALASTGFMIVITGDYLRTRHGRKYFQELAKIKGVILTGYLPYEEYAWLLRNAAAVLGLTNSNYIMLRAFWEAAAYSKPVVAPKTSVMIEIMNYYPYYNVYMRGSLRNAIKELKSNYSDAVRRGFKLSFRLNNLSNKSLKKQS